MRAYEPRIRKRGLTMARILIVDDAMFMRASLKKLLVEHGYTVCGEAGDGKEAIAKFQELKPDVTILDITMPEMSGIEALRCIKEIDPSAKTIICSAMGQQAQLAQAIQYGAKDFIVKPFQEDRLLAAVEKVLS